MGDCLRWDRANQHVARNTAGDRGHEGEEQHAEDVELPLDGKGGAAQRKGKGAGRVDQRQERDIPQRRCL